MPSQAEDIVGVRREILDLLRLQMEALNSPIGVTDDQLRECYERQGRVQELRERMQACLNAENLNPEKLETNSTLSFRAAEPLETAA